MKVIQSGILKSDALICSLPNVHRFQHDRASHPQFTSKPRSTVIKESLWHIQRTLTIYTSLPPELYFIPGSGTGSPLTRSHFCDWTLALDLMTAETLLHSSICLLPLPTMSWPTINTDWDIDHGDRDQYYTIDPTQAQAQQSQGTSPDFDWAKTDCTRPASLSTWNTTLASQAMPTSNEWFDWSMLSSADPASTISTVFNNPTPNLSPNYVENLAGGSSHVPSISPGSQTMSLPIKSIEGDTCNNEVYHQALAARPHPRVQSTRKKTRNAQQYVLFNLLDTLPAGQTYSPI